MTIENMREDDLVELASLAEQLGYPNSVEDLKCRFLVLNDDPNYALFVARSEGNKIVGYVQINREVNTLLAAPRAEIAALVVDQAVRSQGIGSALLKHAENWAKSKKLGLIRIRSNVKRTDAHRFYQRNGYEIPKSWHLFIKNIS